MLDGKEIISGGYYNNWVKATEFPHDEKYEQRMNHEMAFMDDTAMQLGVFDQRSFYEAFDIFDNQSVEESLESDNMLVRIMAVMDRRVGKRRLKLIKETIFKEFFAIRAEAERI